MRHARVCTYVRHHVMVLRVFFFVEALVVDGDDDVFCFQLMAIITCCSVCYTCPVYAPLCVCVCTH